MEIGNKHKQLLTSHRTKHYVPPDTSVLIIYRVFMPPQRKKKKEKIRDIIPYRNRIWSSLIQLARNPGDRGKCLIAPTRECNWQIQTGKLLFLQQIICQEKQMEGGPDWCAQWIECQPADQGVTSSIPGQGTCLVAGRVLGGGGVGEVTTHWRFSPSLPPSLPLSKK